MTNLPTYVGDDKITNIMSMWWEISKMQMLINEESSKNIKRNEQINHVKNFENLLFYFYFETSSKPFSIWSPRTYEGDSISYL